MTRHSFFAMLATLLPLVFCATNAAAASVALMIGDGLGPEQVKAGGIYKNGKGGSLSFEALPNRAWVRTASANAEITDSAAAATAMATGVKVANGVISVRLPGNGSELVTLVELAHELGMSTGLVTTTSITHATPAAFAAHQESRNMKKAIANDYLTRTRPNVLLGGGSVGISTGAARSAGYEIATDSASLLRIDTEAVDRVYGQFGSTHLPYEHDGVGQLPRLSQMVTVALNILDNDPDGFFLMVEGGRIDHAGHANDILRLVNEVVAFEAAYDAVVAWAAERQDVLILMTADHETGGLRVRTNKGAGQAPIVAWSTEYHTPVNVPLFARGLGADRVVGTLDNTDVFKTAANAMGAPLDRNQKRTLSARGWFNCDCAFAGSNQEAPRLWFVLGIGFVLLASLRRPATREHGSPTD